MAIQRQGRPAWQWGPWSQFGEFERAMNRVFGDLLPKSKEAQPQKIMVKPGQRKHGARRRNGAERLPASVPALNQRLVLTQSRRPERTTHPAHE